MTLQPCEIAVACPTCGAPVAEPCRTVQRVKVEPHWKRDALWRQTYTAELAG